MAALIDERYREVAQWINAVTSHYDYARLEAGAIYLSTEAYGLQVGGTSDQKYARGVLGNVRRVLSDAGVFQAASQGGVAQALDVFALFKVLESGKISSAEAETYLEQRYPGQRWSGGKFGDRSAKQAAAKAADTSAQLVARKMRGATPAGLADTARAASGGAALGPLSGQGIGGSAISIPELPDEYDAQSSRDTLEQVVNTLLANDAAIASGQALRLNPATISGDVLIPGSVQPSAINPLAFARMLNQLPGADQTVILRAARSNGIDRPYVAAPDKGPGRVWQVTTVQYPQGWKPTPGPMRYRVVFPNIEFGIMGTELFGDSWIAASYYGQVELTYGIVLRGIPQFFGRAPVGIMAAWENTAPIALGYQFDTHGFGGNPPWSNADRLYHDRADANYHVATYPYLTAYGTGANSVPSATDIQQSNGFYFMLLTGRTAEEIYQQLNSRSSNSGAHLLEEACGPSTSAPFGLRPRSPVSASLYTWSNVGTAATTTYQARNQAFDPTGSNRVVQGVPFAYDDCDRLKQTPDQFSLLIQPALAHSFQLVTGGGAQTWAKPEVWHANGVRTSLVNGREWAVDVIVF